MCALHEAVKRFGSLPEALRGLDYDSVRIETIPLADGVAMLTGLGGNIAVGYGPDGAVLVDDMFAPLFDKIAHAIDALTPVPVPLRTVINTHWHIDHASGNEFMAEAGATVLAHANVRKRLAAGQRVEFANFDFDPVGGLALPAQTYTDEVTIHANGDTIRVIHVPNAHTDGDTIVKWENANVLHMGDVYVRYGLPFVDLSSEGSVGGYIAGVERGIALCDANTRVVPGHGDLATRADLVAFRDGLQRIAEQVRAAKRAGRTLEQAQREIVIEGWPVPRDVFIQEVRPEVFVAFSWDSL